MAGDGEVANGIFGKAKGPQMLTRNASTKEGPTVTQGVVGIGAGGSGLRITLHSANQDVDEKAEITVALNNPEDAVERMMKALAERFPPESVLTIQPVGEEGKGTGSSKITTSSFSDRGHLTPSTSRNSSSESSRSADDPPARSSSFDVLKQSPRTLKELLRLASRGGNVRDFARDAGLEFHMASRLVENLANDPDFYDLVDRMTRRATDVAPQHTQGQNIHGTAGAGHRRKKDGQSRSRGGENGGQAIQRGIPNGKRCHGHNGHSVRDDSYGTAGDGDGQYIVGSEYVPAQNEGTGSQKRNGSHHQRAPSHRHGGSVRGFSRPDRAETNRSRLIAPHGRVVQDTHHQRDHADSLYLPEGHQSREASALDYSMETADRPYIVASRQGLSARSDFSPNFGEHVEILEDGTRVRYVEVEVVQEKIIEVPKIEVKEIEKIENVREVREVEKIEEFEEIEWTEKRVEVVKEHYVTKEVPVEKIVDRPREMIVEQEVLVPRVVEKQVEVQEVIEVPKIVNVEERISVNRFINHESPTIVAQRLRPIVRESENLRRVATKSYEPVLYLVDVYVPKPIPNALVPLGKVDDRHQIVEVPAAQYNTLLKNMNTNVPPNAIQDLFVREMGGMIPMLPPDEYNEIVPPHPNVTEITSAIKYRSAGDIAAEDDARFRHRHHLHKDRSHRSRHDRNHSPHYRRKY